MKALEEQQMIASISREIASLKTQETDRINELKNSLEDLRKETAEAKSKVEELISSKPEKEKRFDELGSELERLSYLREHFDEEFVAWKIGLSNKLEVNNKKQK